MKGLRQNALAREITLVIVIKLAVLFALWYAFFRDPVDQRLTDAAVSRMIVGSEASIPRSK